MSDFQITIVPARGVSEDQGKPGTPYSVTQHKRGDAVVEKIEELEDVWDQVIAKLTDLASKSHIAAGVSQYELSEIEFNIGIEAGLSIGLVTKGNASVSITFSRRQEGPKDSG